MADYIYLLENRLSLAQQRALGAIRTVVRSHDLTLFLTGGAVRDLTSGASVRDLKVTVQGDVSPLRPELEAAGGVFKGENEPAGSLYFTFPGGVRVEVATAVSVSYPKPGQPEYAPASIIEDLRSRDFTANAMALSLNEGSYGLLLDPLNGVADIENRELRLVSNYGFIEEPSRLIRAVRLVSRLGWQMEERTRARYETAKEEGYISALSNWSRGYELEEIFHEEDPLRILRALEAEGWTQHLFAALSSAKANAGALSDLADKLGQLHTQGILASSAAVSFPLLTAKMTEGEVREMKALFPRQGFVQEIESLEGRTRELQTRFTGKEAALPSAAWRMLHEAEPEVVLSMAFSGKGANVQGRLKTFLTDSPAARQRVPYLLMQEMRITPDVPGYSELLDKLFFELMDGKLQTPEEMKAFLEPYSPPAPPPPVNLRRPRAKKEGKGGRGKGKKAKVEEEQTLPSPEEEMELPETMSASEEEEQEAELEPEEPVAAEVEQAPKAEAKKAQPAVKAKQTPSKSAAPAPAQVVESVAPKAPAAAKKVAPPPKSKVKASPVAVKAKAPAKESVTAPKKAAKTASVKKPVAKPAARKAVASRPAPPAKKAAAKKQIPGKKVATKPAPKVPVKAAKPAAKKVVKAPAKKTAAKPAAKKTAPAARKSAPTVAKKAAKKSGRGR